jgi:hypothetical protein
VKAVLALTFISMLTACGDGPSQTHMLEIASLELAMPNCEGRQASFVSRDPGGGFLGGGFTFTVTAPRGCMQQWTDILSSKFRCMPEAAMLECDIDLNGLEERAVIKMIDGKTMKIYRWTTT